MNKKLGIECDFGFRLGTGRTREHLWASYEVAGMSISDDYTSWEITAEELLRIWATWVEARYPSGIVPINWYVQGKQRFEALPGRIDPYGEGYEQEDFLNFFTRPIRTDTGEPLRWSQLPFEDLEWNEERNDKGGFIQEATGWKPSIFQPFVLIDHLLGTSPIRGADEVYDFLSSLWMPEALR